jgi:hypothetical protein
MKQALIFISSTLFLAFLAYWLVPIWWFFAFAPFVIAYLMAKSAKQAFFWSFVALFMLWFGLAFMHSFSNQYILLEKMTEVIKLPHHVFLLLFTALIGALVAGFAGLSGFFLRNLVKQNTINQ